GEGGGEWGGGEEGKGGGLSRRCGPGRNPREFRVDDAGGVDPYEHLAFAGMGLRRVLVGERLGATACAQTDRLHIPPPSSCWPNSTAGAVQAAEQRTNALWTATRYERSFQKR